MNVRRFNDVVVALLLLLVSLPVLLVACLALWAESRTSPIQRLERLMPDRRVVRVFRLRTTRDTPYGARLTAVGDVVRRTRLDHVPQLLNFLNGDLSLGPAEPTLGKSLNAQSLTAPCESPE